MEPQDPHFLALVQRVLAQFQPAASYEQAGLQLSTAQVFERLQALYPSDTYQPADVYRALEAAGFVHADPFRQMEFVWLFQ